MTIRTYRARTAGEALAQIKQELGRSAVILHTRTVRSKGILGFGRSEFTEITATTEQHAPRAPKLRGKPEESRSPGADSSESDPARTGASRPRAERPTRWQTDSVSLSTHAASAASAQRAGTEGSAASSPPLEHDPLAGVTTATPMREVAQMIVQATERPRLEEEMAAIKCMVGQMLSSTRGQRGASMPDALFKCYLRLMESEVAAEIADSIIGKARDELSPAELEDSEIVRSAVLRRLAAYIPISDDVMRTSRAADSRPTTIALVGPTGVGKTTTVAKLAATYKLRHGRNVGLVTCDTYRIAAVDQLRTYANIIGIDIKVVLTPREMAVACDSLAGCDVILIDTAGRAPRDAGRLSELQGFLEASRPHQVHLVLSSASSQSCLEQAASQFGSLGCNRVIFTKLDEAVNFGVLVNVASKLETSLSFVTTGQEVPDHIEAGNADRLARFVLGQEGLG